MQMGFRKMKQGEIVPGNHDSSCLVQQVGCWHRELPWGRLRKGVLLLINESNSLCAPACLCPPRAAVHGCRAGGTCVPAVGCVDSCSFALGKINLFLDQTAGVRPEETFRLLDLWRLPGRS